MALASGAAVIEFASYLPKGSPFRDSVSEIFGSTAIDTFKPPTRYRFPDPKLPDPLSRFPGGPTDDGGDGIPESGDRKVKALAKIPEAVEIASEFAEGSKNSVKIDKESLHELSEILRKAEKRTRSARIARDLKTVLMGILIGFSVIQIDKAWSNSQIQMIEQENQYIGIYRVMTKETNLNLRSSPEFDTQENILGSIPRLENVFVIEELENSYLIDCSALATNFSETRCYVHKDYLERVSIIRKP